MKKGQGWTTEQLDYLRGHYASEKAEDIGKVIGRSKSSVQHKANRMNIGKDREAFRKIRSKAHSGANSGNFKNYQRKTSKGYIARYEPDHPSASKTGLVMEHRLIVEKALGITLPKEFDVHHINGDKTDNRLENLAIMIHSAHSIIHNKEGKQKKGAKNPLYVNIDIEQAKELRRQGIKVKDVCKILGIKKSKYYKEMRGA